MHMNLLLRPIFHCYRLYSGLRYRAMRRFTRVGLAILGALAIATLLGLDADKTVAYKAFTTLFSVILLGMCFGFRFRARFSIERALPRFGTVGAPLRYRVQVKNLNRRSQADLRLLENLADDRPSYVQWKAEVRDEARLSSSFRVTRRRRRHPFRRATIQETTIPTLQPGGSAEAEVQLVPWRRGVLRFTGATVVRADPLGIFRSFSRVHRPETTLILPKRYPLPALQLPGSMRYQEGGVVFSSNVGRSEEFVSLRDYRRGDPIRKIHWRSWAKVGRPIVKECEDEFFVRQALVLDTFSPQSQSEVFEEAVSLAASFACTVLTQESLLDLLFVGSETYCFTSGRGLAQTDQILEVLASVQVCANQAFEQLETAVLNHAGAVSGCICIFLAWDEARRELVRKLRLFAVPVLVMVIKQRNTGGEFPPGPMKDAPDRFHVLEAGRIEEGVAGLQ
jgi:uncharacterized protein (DUF58 family)